MLDYSFIDPTLDSAIHERTLVDRRPRTQSVPLSKSVSPTDDEIGKTLKDYLRKQKWYRASSLYLTVAGGTVTVWGLVISEKARRHLETAAKNTPGVKAVHNFSATLPVPTVSL